MKTKVRAVAALPSIILAAGCAIGQTTAASPANGTVYFLRDDIGKQWCGYASEARFRAQVESLKALTVGGLDYNSGRISMIHITEADETGDWTIYDEYIMDQDQKIRELKRKIEIIPENASEEYQFRIVNNKPTELRSTYRDLDSGKPRPRPVDWFKQPPIMTEFQRFPFWPLISLKRQEILSKGEACVPANRT